MSHSLKDPRRAWDAGMRDDDYVSIVLFEQSPDSPIDLTIKSPVHFVSVTDLRAAFSAKRVAITKPKGVEEGSEIRVVWTSAVANQRSAVSEITATRVQLTPDASSRIQTIQLSRKKGEIQLSPQVQLNEEVEANQIVAAVVPVRIAVPLPPEVDESYFIGMLASINLSERYAAAKALRYLGYTNALPLLVGRVDDPHEDIYVQLEAAAALAAHEHAAGWTFIEAKLRSAVLDVPLETQLETLIVASEIANTRSERILIDVLTDAGRDEELRAGAAWALGQFATATSATALADTFNSTALEIKTEAARALLRITEPQLAHVVELLKTSDSARRDGLSWALARTGGFDPSDILHNADDNLRRWVSYIIGHGKDKLSQEGVNAICDADPEVYFAASVLWQILESWVDGLEEF